ncbi:MAG: GGDEF domain-containing protein [Burkholderiales bacterium]|nr:MAG: GGDEF domain-containing protein [Burkholderiales bacterium]
METLHVDTLLSVYQLVTAMLAVATLGGAWQLKAEPALRFWAAAFAASALTQTARAIAMGTDAARPWLAIGHLGGMLSALFVLLGLRVFLGHPLRWRWPVASAAAVCVAAPVLVSQVGALWPSLMLTLLASALLTAPAARLAQLAWRRQPGFPMLLMSTMLLLSAVVETARSVAVFPAAVPTRELAVQYNAIGLLATIGLVIGQALAMLLLLQDRALRQIERLIEVDVLTGLLNRRGFDERLRRLLQRGGPQLPVLAVLDVDHFKRINDTHGHAVGDAVLSTIGERLRETLRPLDLAVRLGGEEFAVIWAQPEPGGEARLGERLREVVAGESFVTTAGPLTVTVSVGVARARASCEAPEAVFSRADAALYEAKRAGRDQVKLAA